MASKNEMILLDRDEAEAIAERELTNQEWQVLNEELATSDTMWQVIDEFVKQTVDEVING